jgi:hypothetical protein
VQVKDTGGSIGGVGTQVDQDGQSEWQGPSPTAILNILNSASQGAIRLVFNQVNTEHHHL